jgi:hypothetical protein
MRKANNHTEAEFAELHAVYESEWRHFSVAVSHKQSLQTGQPMDANVISGVEMATDSAESQYREARNALAEYILEHACRRSMLVGSR